MDENSLRRLLEAVRARECDVDEAVQAMRRLPFEDLGFAKVDHHRGIRCGFPEVIYCEGKQVDQVVAVTERRLAGGGNVLATRASPEVARAVRRRFPRSRYNPLARTITIRQETKGRPRKGAAVPPPAASDDGRFVAIVCAGTADMPVAEEARETCEIMDQPTRQFYDVGVAGIHRLLAHVKELGQARAIVVCAGMEGALPSVVGGLVSCPVIAVPTSVGYGASLGGLAPLLTMLNSCASGVSVVNIDNGFGGGYIAALICRGSVAVPPAVAEDVTAPAKKRPSSRGGTREKRPPKRRVRS
jgi:NCAIR mutase (PurE)-related protein